MRLMDGTITYIEHDIEHSVSYHWHKSKILFRQTTHRGTLFEIVDRPEWGLSVYMNGVIQSCETDERIYHKTLVHDSMKWLKDRHASLRVCILGGGEGATAYRVLHHTNVTHVDMIEWDRDVVDAFRSRFRQWGQDAWDDARLHIHAIDVFEYTLPEGIPLYDLVIADLFDIHDSEIDKWLPLLEKICDWSKDVLTLYVGTHTPFVDTKMPLVRKFRKVLRKKGYTAHIQSVFIPSFHGYSVFLIGKKLNLTKNNTVTESVTESVPESVSVSVSASLV